MLKKHFYNLFFSVLVLCANSLIAGDFLPFFPNLDVSGNTNIDNFPISGVVNLGDSSVINTLTVDNNNKIVAGGFVNVGFNTNFLLARYNDDGTLDTTFNPDGPQPGIVVTNAYNNQIQNGLNTGSPLSNGNQAINNIVIDNNNRIVAVGYVNDGTNNFFTVARYNTDGSLDTTFSPQGTGTNVPGILITDIVGGNATATAVIIDSNNKIVVTGYSQITSGQSGADKTDIALVRYNDDGSLDTTLNSSGLISGLPGVIVTNVTGSLQTSITGRNNWAYSITIDNENRILVAGAADITTTVGSATTSESTGSLVIRYNPDGTLDTTFNAFGIQNGPPGAAITVVNNTDRVNSVKIDNNNKIVLMGYSTFATNDAGQGANLFVVRYNEDASFDTTFNTGALLAPFIQGIVITDIPGHPLVGNSGFIDNDNNIVIGGWTSNQLSNFEVNAINVSEVDFLVVRYTPSGALDVTFNSLVTPGFVITTIPNQSQINGFLPNAKGNSVVLDNNNNIVLGGFSSNGPEKDMTIARYTNAGVLDVTTFNPLGIISNQPGVVIIDATGGINPYNASGVALTLSTMTDVLNLANIAVDSERAARISSFYVGFRRPIIEGPVDILKDDDSDVVLTGTAHPLSTIHLALNGLPLFSFQVSAEGSWVAKLPPLSDGHYHIYASSTDPESHLTFSSNSVNLMVKTQSYIEPSIDTPNTNEYLDSRSISTTGRAEPNGPVLLFLNKKFVGKTRASNDGTWEYELSDLPDGKYFLNVFGFDELGHVNRSSPAVNFFVDKVQLAPTINTPLNDQTIRENYVHISGNAKPFAQLSLLLNDDNIGTVVADSKGKWRVKLTDLKQHAYKVQVISAGVKKLSSEIINFKVIKKQTMLPLYISKLKGKRPGAFADPNAMWINGALGPQQNLKLFMNGDHLADLKSDHTGLWNHSLDLNKIPDGEHNIQYALLDDNNKMRLLVQKPVIINKQSW